MTRLERPPAEWADPAAECPACGDSPTGLCPGCCWAWTDLEREQVQGLVRKHWPALAVALDRMRDAQ